MPLPTTPLIATLAALFAILAAGSALRYFGLRNASPEERQRVVLAFRLATGRSPTAEEAEALSDYARQHGLIQTCRVILNLNEFAFVD